MAGMLNWFQSSSKTVLDSFRNSPAQEEKQDRRTTSRQDSRQDTQRADGHFAYTSETPSDIHSHSRPPGGLYLEEEWPCSACTFLNNPANPVCEVCGTARGPGAAQMGPGPSPAPEPPLPGPSPFHDTDMKMSRQMSQGGSSSGSAPQGPGSRVQKKDSSQRRSRRRPDAVGSLHSPRTELGLEPDADVHLRQQREREREREREAWEQQEQYPRESREPHHHHQQQQQQRAPEMGVGPRPAAGPAQQSVSRGSDHQMPWGEGGPVVRTRSHPSEDELRLGTTHAAVSSSSRPRDREVHWPPRPESSPYMSHDTETKSRGLQQQQMQQQQQQQQQLQPAQVQPSEESLVGWSGGGAAGGGSGGGSGGIAGARLRLRVLRAFNLRNTDIGILPEDVSDPFVVARLGRQEFKTPVIENNLNPVWNNSAQFEFAVTGVEDTLFLEVFNSNQWHAHDSLGRMQVLVQNLTPGENHTVLERLDEGGIVREDGLQAKLEIEVKLLTADHSRPGRAGALVSSIPCQQAPGSPQLALGSQQPQKATNWVPLPSFHGFGPEAFQAPPPTSVEDAPTGRARRMEEYESMASRLGQYDYSSDPAYFPKQEEVDKRSWKEDPFYGWRRDLQRQETHAAGPLAASKSGLSRRNVLAEINERAANELWHKDPFHGWLKQEQGAQQPEQGLERIQEARVARELLALPSFHEADVKRFSDHRDYSGLHKIVPRERWGGLERERATDAPEQRWREDAFFGWLPGRGPEDPRQSTLHRPLEQARLNRLPSFSEDPALRGITGRGVGVLRVWINAAYDLAYTEGGGLRGKPSACVKLKLGRNKEQFTSTVPTNNNPCWNSPPMVFEVESMADKLQLEVVDLVNSSQGQAHHQYFLGRVELDLHMVVEQLAQQQQEARGQPLRLTPELQGSQRQAQLEFDVLYEPYDGEAPGSWRARHPHNLGMGPHASRTFSAQSFRSTGSSDALGLGMLSVRVIAAYDLVNADSGILGDVSDPYVYLRLGSQQEKQRKRTNTISNNLNPTWNSSPFLFPVHKEDDTLHLEVYDEDTFSADDFLGRLIVPLYRIIGGQPNRAVRIRDRLQDIAHGELEVEIGFSPG